MTDEQTLAFNRRVIDEFRAGGGQLGGRFAGNPTLLLTMTGARSGRRLTTPLTYHTVDGDLVVMASAGGDERHPAWYHNLVAHPEVEVEVGTDAVAATAVPATGEDRRRLLDSMAHAMPRFGDYQAGVAREIPMFRLIRSARPGATAGSPSPAAPARPAEDAP